MVIYPSIHSCIFSISTLNLDCKYQNETFFFFPTSSYRVQKLLIVTWNPAKHLYYTFSSIADIWYYNIYIWQQLDNKQQIHDLLVTVIVNINHFLSHTDQIDKVVLHNANPFIPLPDSSSKLCSCFNVWIGNWYQNFEQIEEILNVNCAFLCAASFLKMHWQSRHT